MANNDDDISTGTDPSALSSVPDDDEVQTLVKRIRAARNAAVTPVDMQKYDDAEDEAKQLYKDQASRSEWLSLADRIGRSMIRLGAANTGLAKGVDMSHVDLGDPYDLNTAMNRAARDYQTELGLQEQRRQRSLQNQGQEIGMADKAFDLAGKEKALASQEARSEANRTSAENRQDTRIAASENAQTRRMREQEALQSGRFAQQSQLADQMEQNRQGRMIQRESVKDLQTRIADQEKAVKAAEALRDQQNSEGDVGRKTRDQMISKYGTLMGAAHIDPNQLNDIQDRSLTGGVGGFFRKVDPKTKNDLYQKEIINPMVQEREKLRQRLDNILTQKNDSGSDGEDSSSAPAETAASSTGSSGGQGSSPMILVRHKATGVTKSVTKDQLNLLPVDQFEIVK